MKEATKLYHQARPTNKLQTWSGNTEAMNTTIGNRLGLDIGMPNMILHKLIGRRREFVFIPLASLSTIISHSC